MANRRHCWVCGSDDTRPFKDRSIHRSLVPQDFRITDAGYGATLGLRRCRDCGFIFADEDDVAELVELYEKLEDPAYEETQESRATQMEWLLKRAARLCPSARTVLDIGAGAGLLVNLARRAGYDAVGVEPSRWLVDAARRLHQVELLPGTFPHPALGDRQFDLIFLVDVIEHVANPLELLHACRDSLTPEGMILLVTPDIGSLTARCLGHRWWHLRLAHVGYFDRQSLLRLVDRCRLEVVHSCRPTWYFRLKYVAERLVQYLPIGWLNRLAERFGPLRRLYDIVVPVNPRDSMLVALRRAG
ncbi:MAG: class I SAM-dependent methyltransferase [Pirellulales bacterium]|nr:class I SAM-dependent methyltransferase [Pirellulales bacterium]